VGTRISNVEQGVRRCVGLMSPSPPRTTALAEPNSVRQTRCSRVVLIPSGLPDGIARGDAKAPRRLHFLWRTLTKPLFSHRGQEGECNPSQRCAGRQANRSIGSSRVEHEYESLIETKNGLFSVTQHRPDFRSVLRPFSLIVGRETGPTIDDPP
jgi:hypothetical protein